VFYVLYILIFFLRCKRADIYQGYSLVARIQKMEATLKVTLKKMRILSVSVDVHATLRIDQISKLFKRTIVRWLHDTVDPFQNYEHFRIKLSILPFNVRQYFLSFPSSFICPGERSIHTAGIKSQFYSVINVQYSSAITIDLSKGQAKLSKSCQNRHGIIKIQRESFFACRFINFSWFLTILKL